MPQKLIIFDATLFINAYETQLFRTGLVSAEVSVVCTEEIVVSRL